MTSPRTAYKLTESEFAALPKHIKLMMLVDIELAKRVMILEDKISDLEARRGLDKQPSSTTQPADITAQDRK
jgi:hypothetical protein